MAEGGGGTSVSVELALLTLAGDERTPHALLLEDAAGWWRLPGDELGAGEDLEQAARRVLAGVGVADPRHLEQLASFGAPDRVPSRRVVSVTYLSLLPDPSDPVAGSAWWPLDALPDLAWDHDTILTEALQRVRAKLSYSTIAYGLLPDEFTLSELQEVYEACLGTKLDKRNFRKKVRSLDLLEEVPGMRRGSHRPAQLYAFSSRGLVVLDDVIATGTDR